MVYDIIIRTNASNTGLYVVYQFCHHCFLTINQFSVIATLLFLYCIFSFELYFYNSYDSYLTLSNLYSTHTQNMLLCFVMYLCDLVVFSRDEVLLFTKICQRNRVPFCVCLYQTTSIAVQSTHAWLDYGKKEARETMTTVFLSQLTSLATLCCMSMLQTATHTHTHKEIWGSYFGATSEGLLDSKSSSVSL